MAAALLQGFTLTFRNQSSLPIRRIRSMCASSRGRQLLRAAPSPKAHCAGTAPWFPDNINARQMSLNYCFFLNIQVQLCRPLCPPTEFLPNLLRLLIATQHWPSVSSTSTTSEPFTSLMVGKSIGNKWAYLYFKPWCAVFFGFVTSLLL